MTTIHKQTILELYYINILYEIHKVDEKLKLLKSKYKITLKQFEKKIKTGRKENFDHWDDYMEWKAYDKSQKELIRKKNDILNGNYKIS
jgi:hypothetical protein